MLFENVDNRLSPRVLEYKRGEFFFIKNKTTRKRRPTWKKSLSSHASDTRPLIVRAGTTAVRDLRLCRSAAGGHAYASLRLVSRLSFYARKKKNDKIKGKSVARNNRNRVLIQNYYRVISPSVPNNIIEKKQVFGSQDSPRPEAKIIASPHIELHLKFADYSVFYCT